MDKMPEDCFNVIICDPPDRFDVEYKSQSDYDKWSKKWIKRMKNVLSEDGKIYLFVSYNTIDNLDGLMSNYFTLESKIRWKFNLFHQMEYIILVYVNSKKSKINQEEHWHDIIILEEEKNLFVELLQANPKKICQTRLPENLIARIINNETERLGGREQIKLYDMFSGSGIVLNVASDMGINYTGTEINKRYYKEIIKNLKEESHESQLL